MADETPATDLQDGQNGPQEPTRTPSPSDMPSHAQQPEQDTSTDELAGLKSALDKERANAKEARAEFSAFRDAFTKALGLDRSEQLTPEQLTAQVTEQTGRADAAERQLAVFRALPATVDKDALLDSTAFQKAISDVTPDKVAETVTSFVDDHPRFLRTNPGAGASDAGATNPPAPAKSMDDWIRGN